ncbi:hypothetical protein ACG6R3_000461 [Enterococcus faecium]
MSDQQTLPVIKEFQGAFLHPGISLTKENLLLLQEQISAKKNPWYDYYQGMKQSKYATKEFHSENLLAGTFATPQQRTFASRKTLDCLNQDAYRGYTQILLYLLTGEAEYYDNAVRLFRIWSQLDSAQVRYFPDAHIHVGWPLYYLVSTGELLRVVTPPSATSKRGREENYQEEDGNNLIANFLKPAIDHFYREPDRYMNQLGYQNVGRIAAAIFMDDAALFEETIEWITVNKTTSRPQISGSIRFLFQWVTKQDSRNPIKEDYVQLMELGRDSCHAFDDLSVIALLGRMLGHQQVKVDPHTGTLTAEPEGISIYEFDKCAILRGAEQYFRFTYGQSVPWTAFSRDGGKEFPALEADGVQNIIDYGKEIAQLERGRTRMIHTFSELYDVYRTQLGWSKEELAKVAPAISRAAQQLQPPVYYEGNQKMNFWEVTKDLTPEYWTNIPVQRGVELAATIGRTAVKGWVNPVVAGTILNHEYTETVQEDKESWLKLHGVTSTDFLSETDYQRDFPLDHETQCGGNHFVLTNLRTSQQWLALTIRTNGQGQLLISGGNNGGSYQEPYLKLDLPDTKGQWLKIAYNRDSSENPQARKASEMDFIALVASEDMTAEIKAVSFLEELSTNADSFGLPKCLWGIVGESTQVSLPVQLGKDLQWSVSPSLSEVSIEPNGLLDWTPSRAKQETVILMGKMKDDLWITKELKLQSSDDSNGLKKALNQSFDTTIEYTRDSQEKLASLFDKLAKSTTGQEVLQVAATMESQRPSLQPLNPRLKNGTLAYASPDFVKVTSEREEKITVANLTDGDTETIDGNLLSKWLCFDFGSDFRICAKRFGFEARTGFPNRTEGQRVYGSVNGKEWLCLTMEATSSLNHLQWLTVAQEYQQKAFRYLKVVVDFPGPDTDPAYPGIACRGEFYIDGKRLEVTKN